MKRNPKKEFEKTNKTESDHRLPHPHRRRQRPRRSRATPRRSSLRGPQHPHPVPALVPRVRDRRPQPGMHRQACKLPGQQPHVRIRTSDAAPTPGVRHASRIMLPFYLNAGPTFIDSPLTRISASLTMLRSAPSAAATRASCRPSPTVTSDTAATPPCPPVVPNRLRQ